MQIIMYAREGCVDLFYGFNTISGHSTISICMIIIDIAFLMKW